MAKRAAPPPLFAPPKEWLLAAQEGNVEKLRGLLATNEWKVTDKDDDKRTALHWAAAKGKEAAVKFILAQGADPNTADEEGWTPLISATSANHLDVVKALLQQDKINVNAATASNRTALHYACSKNNATIASLLLKAGANPTMKANDGASPIHRAASGGNPQLLTMLLESGANVDSQNRAGETALHISVMEEHRPLVFLLIEHGASVDLRNSDGKTADDVASEAMKRALRQALSEAKK